MKGILDTLFDTVLLPEIMKFIRERVAATGHVPTDAEVIAARDARADAIIAKGTAFLGGA